MPSFVRNRSYRTGTAPIGFSGSGESFQLNDISSLPTLSTAPTQDTHDEAPVLPQPDGEKQRYDRAGPGPPPNGGRRAWLQVLGAFFLNFNTW